MTTQRKLGYLAIIVLSFVIWGLALWISHGLLFLLVDYYGGVLIITLIILIVGIPIGTFIQQVRSTQSRLTSIKMAKTMLIINFLIPLSMSAVFFIPPFPNTNMSPQLWITNVTGDYGLPDVEISYWTQHATKESIMWGKNGTPGITLTDTSRIAQHQFRLVNLQYNTSYWIMINDQTYTFATPANASAIRLGIAADLHFTTTPSNVTTTGIDSMIMNNFDYCFLSGDFVDMGIWKSQWKAAFRTTTNLTLQSPTRILRGNHDVMFNGWYLYNSYCLPATSNTTFDYLRIGDLHILLLDLEWSMNINLGVGQRQWLEETLAQLDPTDHIVVIAHAPVLSSKTEHRILASFSDYFDVLFSTHGVDAFISGHTHITEVLERNGVRYIQCGTLSAKQYDYYTVSPYSVYRSTLPTYLDLMFIDDTFNATIRSYNGSELFTTLF